MVMEQITEYQNVCDGKVILEKTLRSVLGDKIGTEINNLQEFKQGLQAVEMVKKMFVNVPNTITEDMIDKYVLNTNTKKFHLPTCDSVSEMKEKNKKEVEGNREDIIKDGYSPCGRCNP